MPVELVKREHERLVLVVRKRSEQEGEVSSRVLGKCRSSQDVEGI